MADGVSTAVEWIQHLQFGSGTVRARLQQVQSLDSGCKLRAAHVSVRKSRAVFVYFREDSRIFDYIREDINYQMHFADFQPERAPYSA